mmetsp:Transcript_9775/g.31385  ORF Transcript_9775/g.31385 Transcript_9775/m.31385 type:complete len:465 (+) Transcript_9775:1143-2537(+)
MSSWKRGKKGLGWDGEGWELDEGFLREQGLGEGVGARHAGRGSEWSESSESGDGPGGEGGLGRGVGGVGGEEGEFGGARVAETGGAPESADVGLEGVGAEFPREAELEALLDEGGVDDEEAGAASHAVDDDVGAAVLEEEARDAGDEVAVGDDAPRVGDEGVEDAGPDAIADPGRAEGDVGEARGARCRDAGHGVGGEVGGGERGEGAAERVSRDEDAVDAMLEAELADGAVEAGPDAAVGGPEAAVDAGEHEALDGRDVVGGARRAAGGLGGRLDEAEAPLDEAHHEGAAPEEGVDEGAGPVHQRGLDVAFFFRGGVNDDDVVVFVVVVLVVVVRGRRGQVVEVGRRVVVEREAVLPDVDVGEPVLEGGGAAEGDDEPGLGLVARDEAVGVVCVDVELGERAEVDARRVGAARGAAGGGVADVEVGLRRDADEPARGVDDEEVGGVGAAAFAPVAAAVAVGPL